MRILETIAQVRDHVAAVRQGNCSVGLVPTMGDLHDGHWALIDRAQSENDRSVVSIFVNPTQFGPGEDFERYPRPRDADLAGCRERGVSAVFYPSVSEMYAPDASTRISAGPRGEKLCGRFRPGHFDGVCTVVCKLLNIVQPQRAYFGEKDYQQLVIIRRMVRDLDIPVEIVGCPTVRQPDGLALSSRNRYLSETSRKNAAAIFAAMTEASERIKQESRDARELCRQIEARLIAAGAKSIDYAAIVDPQTLDDVMLVDRPVRICVAARFEGARLIDNLAVDDLPPAG